MCFSFAFGGLSQPAHNQLSQRPNARHSFTAVPHRCGQLGSGLCWALVPAQPAVAPAVPYAGSKRLPFVTTAYAKCINFRAQAHRATFAGLPAARNR